jgi:uncharacterized protein (DUF362 family)
MGEVVGLVRTGSTENEIRDSVNDVLNLIDFKNSCRVKSVCIKVNLCYYWGADTGYTTDPKVVAGLIDCLRDRFGGDIDVRIVESDATAMRVKHAFRMLGYEKLAIEKNVELFNLSLDELTEQKLNVNGRLLKFKVPACLTNCDLFINLPKLKVQVPTYITCALKNIFGCIGEPRKVVYHEVLSEAIVGINKVLHPHLTIVDGVTALGRVPIKLGLIMASIDPFSIDWVASQIMGYNPRKIEFMKLAAKEGLGNPDGVIIKGEEIQTFKNIFPKQNYLLSRFIVNLQKDMLRIYEKMVHDIVPPTLEGL